MLGLVRSAPCLIKARRRLLRRGPGRVLEILRLFEGEVLGIAVARCSRRERLLLSERALRYATWHCLLSEGRLLLEPLLVVH